MTVTGITNTSHHVDVTFDDNETMRFISPWLRDNISSGRHRKDGQRTFDINSLPPAVIIDASQSDHSVTIQFSPNGPIEEFDEEFLRSNGGTSSLNDIQPHLWGSEISSSLTFVDYDSVPTEPESVLAVVDLLGYTRQTNYGRLFDVRVEDDPANLAFTSLEVGMHTDNPYRDPVPGLQLLHCLVNDSDGGDSQLCDGFKVAESIRHDHPGAFELLSQTPVAFQYLEEGLADLRCRVPLIRVDARGEVIEVRYNSRSIQAFDMPPDLMSDYYDAYRILGRELHDHRYFIEFRLDAGQLMVFDNQRVLHGRSSYSQGGARHLQGCYAAEERGEPDTLVAACLMHDVGHWLDEPDDDFGIHAHDDLGGDWVAARFPVAISEPVRLHVAAKRYLCTMEPAYHDVLSPTSRYTLTKQGGPMSATEASQFADLPFSDAAVSLRRMEDDYGKSSDMVAPPLSHFRKLIDGMARRSDSDPTSDDDE